MPQIPLVQAKMSSISAISTNFMKKTIPFYSLNSTTTKTPLLSLVNKNNYHDKPNVVSLVAHLVLVTNQSHPSEFPSKPNYQPSFLPPEMPETPKIQEIDATPPEVNTDPDPPLSPNNGPEFPGPPMPSPPDPDYPKPSTGTTPPKPPDMPPDVVPPDVPPQLSPPDILPPPGGPAIVF